MYGKVLGAGQQLAILADAEVFTIIAYALETTHYGQSHLRCQIGVFAVGLLTTPPSGIAEDVDVGRPVRQTLIALDGACTFGLLGFHACLVADGGEHAVYHRIIPSGSHRHRDGEDGGNTVTAYTMQGFVPPLELGDSQSGDGW